GGVGRSEMRGLSTRDKAPYVIRILDAEGLSTDFAASLVEIDRTLSSWPQLGGDVQLGGATVAAAVRRIGLGRPLPSGRTRVDIQQCLDVLAEPVATPDPDWSAVPERRFPTAADLAALPTAEAVAVAAGLAPSGGNVQPWTMTVDSAGLRIELDPSATTGMDIGYRGSAVAVGAALHNARAAAAALGVLGDVDVAEGTARLTATLRWGSGADPDLARDYPDLLARHTNRQLGTGTAVDSAVLEALEQAARDGGGVLRWVAGRVDLEGAATLLAASDRIRYLTPTLHAEMFSELRWPEDDLDTGLDLRTLALAPDELAKLAIGRRGDVMARVREFGGGGALGEYSLDRVRTASALVAVCVGGAGAEPGLADYAQAGAAVQRVWVEAGRQGLAVQPMSPVFLYAHSENELEAAAPGFGSELAQLRERFRKLLAVPDPEEGVALVLRVGYAAPVALRSRRRTPPTTTASGPRRR
ncbi:MAG: Rv1355c family protein, partial [Catenulispora sp.]|nr:Rv1355c family protein [Catenulispora sp.]